MYINLGWLLVCFGFHCFFQILAMRCYTTNRDKWEDMIAPAFFGYWNSLIGTAFGYLLLMAIWYAIQLGLYKLG